MILMSNTSQGQKYKRGIFSLRRFENRFLRHQSIFTSNREPYIVFYTKEPPLQHKMHFTKVFLAAAAALSTKAHPFSTPSTDGALAKRATESVHLVCKY